MPTFSNQLPEKTENRGFDLRRTPPDKPIKGLITSNDIIGCYTHWWGGRTVPCEDETCEACKANTPARWHCYIAVVESGSHDHFIFECTGKAALPLTEWRNVHGTLRGTLLTAFRPKRRRNARVEIILKPYDISTIRLPEPPNLLKALSVIWQIPEKAFILDTYESEMPRLQTDKKILEKQRINPADGNGKPKTRKRVSA